MKKILILLSLIFVLNSCNEGEKQKENVGVNSGSITNTGNVEVSKKDENLAIEDSGNIINSGSLEEEKVSSGTITSEEKTEKIDLGNDYSKDDKNVYYYSNIIKYADPGTFELLECKFGESGNNGRKCYGKDKNNVFFKEEVIFGAYPESFEILKNWYSKDNTSLYYFGKKVNGIDISSFSYIKDGYVKDELNIYYRGKKIELADIETFEILKNDYSKDKNNVYYGVSNIPGVDIKSFEVYENSYYAKDSNFVYYKTQKVEGVKPKDFLAINIVGKYKDDYFLGGKKQNKGEGSNNYRIILDKKYNNYYFYSTCGIDVLFLDNKYYNVISSNKLDSFEYENIFVTNDSKYIIFVENGKLNEENGNFEYEKDSFKIYDLENKKFVYTGKFIGELQYWVGYETGCDEKIPITKNKLGYYLEEGIFDDKTGKIYYYSDETKEKLKQKYEFLSNGEGIYFIKNIVSRFDKYYEGGFGETYYKGEICKFRLNENILNIDCKNNIRDNTVI